jgi:hypothetical protein
MQEDNNIMLFLVVAILGVVITSYFFTGLHLDQLAVNNENLLAALRPVTVTPSQPTQTPPSGGCGDVTIVKNAIPSSVNGTFSFDMVYPDGSQFWSGSITTQGGIGSLVIPMSCIPSDRETSYLFNVDEIQSSGWVSGGPDCYYVTTDSKGINFTLIRPPPWPVFLSFTTTPTRSLLCIFTNAPAA